MDPSSPGSLGIAISEAVEVAALNEDTKYCLGSVLDHVLLHQMVIGEDCIKQMEALGETPDVIIGCTGGGSNFAGLCFPFIREKLKGKINPLIRVVEPTAYPSLTKEKETLGAQRAGLEDMLKDMKRKDDILPKLMVKMSYLEIIERREPVLARKVIEVIRAGLFLQGRIIEVISLAVNWSKTVFMVLRLHKWALGNGPTVASRP